MSCFTEVDEMKNYYAFRVRPPSQFQKKAIKTVSKSKETWVDFVTPRWARAPAESVIPGAYVTAGILKNGTWSIQSIKVPKDNRSIRECRKLALEIAGKLRACPEAAGFFPERKRRTKACP